MIPSNAALVEEYWEPLLALPSEPRQVAGREPLSEQRSEGRLEYLGGSLLPLHRHRAPITVTRPMGMATQATDIPPIGILLTDIPVMDSRVTDTQAIQDTPLILVLQAMDIQVTQGILIIRVPQATDTQATRDTPIILVLQTDTQARQEIPLIP